jgi:hypothetical protein
MDDTKSVRNHKSKGNDKIIVGVFDKCFRQRCQKRKTKSVEHKTGNIESHDKGSQTNTHYKEGAHTNLAHILRIKKKEWNTETLGKGLCNTSEEHKPVHHHYLILLQMHNKQLNWKRKEETTNELPEIHTFYPEYKYTVKMKIGFGNFTDIFTKETNR